MSNELLKTRPALSFWQIWNMCFGFLGIQFGFALQNANVSRIFQTLGADMDQLPILWIAAPVTGLIVQPIIGHFSDKTWTSLGRRRPYFLIGAVLSSIALFFMPNSPTLWIAAGTLWIMDASINVSMEPFRAFVGDMLPERQRAAGFSMQTFFIGVGAVVASALPWLLTNILGVSNEAPAGVIPDSVKGSFYFGGAVFLLAVLWTVFRTREYSPEQLRVFEAAEKPPAASDSVAVDAPANFLRLGGALLVAGGVLLGFIIARSLDKQLYILAAALLVFGSLQMVAHLARRSGATANAFYEIIHDFHRMPRVMLQLAVVQFFSWFALFAMWIYGNAAVTSHHYGALDPTSALYNEGANWAGVLFAAYNGFAALAAMLIPMAAGKLGCRPCHSVNLSLGGLGLIGFYFIREPIFLLVPMIGVGIAWASILSLPYVLLSNNLPARKMGVYMGIFNFFIVIPQLIAAAVLGLILRDVFDDQSIFGLVIGGTSMLLAALAVMFVDKKAEPGAA
ncbi:MAG: MFS transporter [Gammaproteobacteria bacterium]